MAWRPNAAFASSGPMPHPSSATWISSEPAFLSVTSTRDAPASSAFSTSSLSALAGRCTTSPAAILLASVSGRGWISPSVPSADSEVSARFMRYWKNQPPNEVTRSTTVPMLT